jgi:ubiquinone/menaquinone biosynthesis C-methylase UbiE
MAITGKEHIKALYGHEAVAEDYIAERFDNEFQRLLHDRQVAAVNAAMAGARPPRALEIAPGPGRLTRDVRPAGSLACLEYNERMIQRGRPACAGHSQWVRGDGFHLPFGQAFDLVYTFRFVRHFLLPDRQRLLAEIRRVLNPGGLLIMDAVNERVSRSLRSTSPEAYPIHDELYRPETLRDELRQAGLELLGLDPVQKFYRWQYQSQVLLGPRANRLNRVLIRGLERLPRRDGLEWIVKCRRA